MNRKTRKCILGASHTQQPPPSPPSILRLQLRCYRRLHPVMHLQCFGSQFPLRPMAQTMSGMPDDLEVTVWPWI